MPGHVQVPYMHDLIDHTETPNEGGVLLLTPFHR